MSVTFLSAVSQRIADSTNVPQILARLCAASVDERRSALEALCELDARNLPAQLHASLVSLLGDDDTDICFCAAGLLSYLSPADLAPLAEGVLGQFDKVPDSARWKIVEVLRNVESATLHLHAAGVIRLLGHSDADVRRRAVELLATMDDVEAFGDAVLPCLKDEDEDVRLSSIGTSSQRRSSSPPQLRARDHIHLRSQ